MPSKKTLIIGAIIGATAAATTGLYFLLKSPKPTQEEILAIQVEEVKKQEQKDELFKQRIREELKTLVVKFDKLKGHILEESIKEINSVIAEYCLPEMRKLFIRYRSERRAILNDPGQYVDLYYKQSDEYFELLRTHEHEVLKNLNIKIEQWEKSINTHMENNDFGDYFNSFVSDIKYQLKSKIVTKDDLVKVYTDLYSNIIPKEVKNIEKVKPKLKSPSDFIMILQEYCNDKVYQKYGFESEDLVCAEKALTKDADILNLSNKVQELYLAQFEQILQEICLSNTKIIKNMKISLEKKNR